jgi:hypothetical protein
LRYGSLISRPASERPGHAWTPAYLERTFPGYAVRTAPEMEEVRECRRVGRKEAADVDVVERLGV